MLARKKITSVVTEGAQSNTKKNWYASQDESD